MGNIFLLSSLIFLFVFFLSFLSFLSLFSLFLGVCTLLLLFPISLNEGNCSLSISLRDGKSNGLGFRSFNNNDDDDDGGGGGGSVGGNGSCAAEEFEDLGCCEDDLVFDSEDVGGMYVENEERFGNGGNDDENVLYVDKFVVSV
jgi:hypothetical protein